jgi:hypothetical protein
MTKDEVLTALMSIYKGDRETDELMNYTPDENEEINIMAVELPEDVGPILDDLISENIIESWERWPGGEYCCYNVDRNYFKEMC